MAAYRNGVIIPHAGIGDSLYVASDLLNTVTANIQMFLKDKSRVMTINAARMAEDFPLFWAWIGADGDLSAAQCQLAIRHNQSKGVANEQSR